MRDKSTPPVTIQRVQHSPSSGGENSYRHRLGHDDSLGSMIENNLVDACANLFAILTKDGEFVDAAYVPRYRCTQSARRQG